MRDEEEAEAVEEGVCAEEDEGVDEDGGPDCGREDPDAGLREDGGAWLWGVSFLVVLSWLFGGWGGGGTEDEVESDALVALLGGVACSAEEGFVF